jgi:hypothetical protein
LGKAGAVAGIHHACSVAAYCIVADDDGTLCWLASSNSE